MPERNEDHEPDCRAGQDGDCNWSGCPQNRDGEPTATGRSCPRWVAETEQGIERRWVADEPSAAPSPPERNEGEWPYVNAVTGAPLTPSPAATEGRSARDVLDDLRDEMFCECGVIHIVQMKSDAILAALTDAGFSIVPTADLDALRAERDDLLVSRKFHMNEHTALRAKVERATQLVAEWGEHARAALTADADVLASCITDLRAALGLDAAGSEQELCSGCGVPVDEPQTYFCDVSWHG